MCLKKRAWIVFYDYTQLWYLRFLKRGYRHCSVVWHDNNHWVSFDPLSNYFDIRIFWHLPKDFNLISYLDSCEGVSTIETYFCRDIKRPGSWFFLTCTSAIKRLLGLKAWWVITPWQLWLYTKANAYKLSQRKYQNAHQHFPDAVPKLHPLSKPFLNRR